MRFRPDLVKKVIDMLGEDLGGGLVATDIWPTAEIKSIAQDQGAKSPPQLITLFYEITQKLDKTLKGADYPGIGRYYLVHLANGNLVVVLALGDYMLYIVVDLSKTTMGILINVAIPNLLKTMAGATKGPGSAGMLEQLNTWSSNTLSRYPWRVR